MRDPMSIDAALGIAARTSYQTTDPRNYILVDALKALASAVRAARVEIERLNAQSPTRGELNQ